MKHIFQHVGAYYGVVFLASDNHDWDHALHPLQTEFHIIQTLQAHLHSSTANKDDALREFLRLGQDAI